MDGNGESDSSRVWIVLPMMVTTMILAHWLGLTRLCPLCVCERERDGATDKSNDLGEAVGIVVVVVLVAQKTRGRKQGHTNRCVRARQPDAGDEKGNDDDDDKER